MTTDVHGGRVADAPPTPHPDSVPAADGANLPAAYPNGSAETALLPAVVDEDATGLASPDPGPPVAYADVQRPAECVVGPLAEVGDLCRWLSEAAARAGQPSSLTLSAGGREAVVHFADAVTLNAWCDWYGVGDLHHTQDVLGDAAEGMITISGWVLRLRLFGPAVKELT